MTDDFIIIDTGGITEEVDEVGKLITNQAMHAIQDADKVLFIIDGRAGITPEDKLIARRTAPFRENRFSCRE